MVLIVSMNNILKRSMSLYCCRVFNFLNLPLNHYYFKQMLYFKLLFKDLDINTDYGTASIITLFTKSVQVEKLIGTQGKLLEWIIYSSVLNLPALDFQEMLHICCCRIQNCTLKSLLGTDIVEYLCSTYCITHKPPALTEPV